MRSSIGVFLAFCLTVASAQTDQNDLDAQLFEALKNEDIGAAAKALEDGANINALSPRGSQTPLMQSVLHGRETMVHFLLERGADTTIPERDGYTPMHGAGFQGRAKIAAMLMGYGVGLRDKHDRDGFEPAIRTCWGNEARHTETLNFFLQNGVPLDDIFADCMRMTSNEGTKAMLTSMKKSSAKQNGEGGEL